MLQEVNNVRQNPREPPRRWFFDDYFDLIVWFNPDGSIASFQLSYDKKGCERLLSWRATEGCSHYRIDDGEQRPFRHKSAPIMVENGTFDPVDVGRTFFKAAETLPEYIGSFISGVIRAHRDKGA